MIADRTQRRLRRILSLLPWLQANPYPEVGEVVRRFGYRNEAELVRDLWLLSMCGPPGHYPHEMIWAQSEDGMVVLEQAEQFASPLHLRHIEALVLLVAGKSVMGAQASVPALERAVGKLAGALPGLDEILVAELPPAPEAAPVLQQAAAQRRVTEITYLSLHGNRETVRLVEPWAVTSHGEHWYLTAFCRLARDRRVFRADRIREAAVSEEEFDPPDPLPPAGPQFVPDEDGPHAVIGLRPAARWVAGYYPVETVSDDPEETVIRFPYFYPRVPARLLMSLGSSARLMEGDEVREEMERLRAEILARYGE